MALSVPTYARRLSASWRKRLNPRRRILGEYATLPDVRRQQERNERLTVEQLDHYRMSLRTMNDWQLETEYRATHNAARSTRHLPSPRLMQELIQLWKELRLSAQDGG